MRGSKFFFFFSFVPDSPYEGQKERTFVGPIYFDFLVSLTEETPDP